jgi:hypothetical protein
MLTDELLLLKSLGNEIWTIQSVKEGGFRGRGKGLINKTKQKNTYERERETEPIPTNFLSLLHPPPPPGPEKIHVFIGRHIWIWPLIYRIKCMYKNRTNVDIDIKTSKYGAINKI